MSDKRNVVTNKYRQIMKKNAAAYGRSNNMMNNGGGSTGLRWFDKFAELIDILGPTTRRDVEGIAWVRSLLRNGPEILSDHYIKKIDHELKRLGEPPLSQKDKSNFKSDAFRSFGQAERSAEGIPDGRSRTGHTDTSGNYKLHSSLDWMPPHIQGEGMARYRHQQSVKRNKRTGISELENRAKQGKLINPQTFTGQLEEIETLRRDLLADHMARSENVTEVNGPEHSIDLGKISTGRDHTGLTDRAGNINKSIEVKRAPYVNRALRKGFTPTQVSKGIFGGVHDISGPDRPVFDLRKVPSGPEKSRHPLHDIPNYYDPDSVPDYEIPTSSNDHRPFRKRVRLAEVRPEDFDLQPSSKPSRFRQGRVIPKIIRFSRFG